MRLIAGTAGSIPLLVPKYDFRPTTDRVREAVFSKLARRLPDARVADLFAGSGAYGLEALSRGAASAVFVEKNRIACEFIQRNAAKTQLTAGADIRLMDVYLWIKSAREPFDLIFADPPYKKSPADFDHAAALLASAELPALVAPEGRFVLESFAGRETVFVPPAWTLLDQRQYGSSLISYLTPAR